MIPQLLLLATLFAVWVFVSIMLASIHLQDSSLSYEWKYKSSIFSFFERRMKKYRVYLIALWGVELICAISAIVLFVMCIWAY